MHEGNFAQNHGEQILERSHRHVVFSLPPGHGRRLVLRVIVSGQDSGTSTLISYLPPVVTAVYPDFGQTRSVLTEEDIADGNFFGRRFEQGDADESGALSVAELARLLQDSSAVRKMLSVTSMDAEFMFSRLDANADGELTLREWEASRYGPTDGCDGGNYGTGHLAGEGLEDPTYQRKCIGLAVTLSLAVALAKVMQRITFNISAFWIGFALILPLVQTVACFLHIASGIRAHVDHIRVRLAR